MSNFAHIKITSDSPMGRHAKVEVNGQDLTSCIQYVDLSYSVDDLITLHLDLLVSDLEIDGPGIVELSREEKRANGCEDS